MIGGSNAAGFLEYFLLAGLAVVCIAAVYYAVRKVQWRQRLVPIVVFLILFFVICCCGVAVRADAIDSMPMVEAVFMPDSQGSLSEISPEALTP